MFGILDTFDKLTVRCWLNKSDRNSSARQGRIGFRSREKERERERDVGKRNHSLAAANLSGRYAQKSMKKEVTFLSSPVP